MSRILYLCGFVRLGRIFNSVTCYFSLICYLSAKVEKRALFWNLKGDFSFWFIYGGVKNEEGDKVNNYDIIRSNNGNISNNHGTIKE